MHIPQYWAQARLRHATGQRHGATVQRWGWSDHSQQEADNHAQQRAQQALDAVLAAMLRCSRGQASELVTAGRVEINHLPAEKPSAPVYEGDVFTVRGKGRFALTALPGKSKKERLIIEFFQY